MQLRFQSGEKPAVVVAYNLRLKKNNQYPILRGSDFNFVPQMYAFYCLRPSIIDNIS